jgi:predicted benzoate:H+ symporter BenE
MRIALLFGLLAGALVVIGVTMHLNFVRGLIGLAIGGAVGFGLAAVAKRFSRVSPEKPE